jgi:hypothetical protein
VSDARTERAPEEAGRAVVAALAVFVVYDFELVPNTLLIGADLDLDSLPDGCALDHGVSVADTLSALRVVG